MKDRKICSTKCVTGEKWKRERAREKEREIKREKEKKRKKRSVQKNNLKLN